MTEMNIPLLRLPYTDEEIAFIKNGIEEILRSGYLTMASKVRKFEEMFAAWCNVRYALGTNSGTSSIEIILRAIGVEGKVVVCPSNTYMATPIAAVHAGAKVAFTDCRRDDMQMCPDSLETVLKARNDIAAVLTVHIGGIISPHFWKIKALCDERNIPIVEDAAHAHGATIDGKFAGSLGIAGSFSFYPTKVLNTAEGGMVTTDSEEIYQKGIILREHGKENHSFNIHTELGYNWRFSELHALLGIQQMMKADEILAERRRIAAKYDELLNGVPGVKLQKLASNVQSAYYKYICFLDETIDRNKLKRRMLDKYGVSLTGEVYSDPCHTQPVFRKYPDTVVTVPGVTFDNTRYVCNNHICPPLYPGLSDKEIEYTVESLSACLR